VANTQGEDFARATEVSINSGAQHVAARAPEDRWCRDPMRDARTQVTAGAPLVASAHGEADSVADYQQIAGGTTEDFPRHRQETI
jgi:hypothetical protein